MLRSSDNSTMKYKRNEDLRLLYTGESSRKILEAGSAAGYNVYGWNRWIRSRRTYRTAWDHNDRERKKKDMEYFNIKKKNGSMVSCVKEIPDRPEAVVIAVHGFTSSKESSTYRMLLDRLPRAGLGMIGIDLPGHGTQESAKELLRIPGALDSIAAAENYAVREYPGLEICYFASSFGAYLTGLYISTREHAGRKLFWRSAAVNMPELFHKEMPTEEEKEMLESLRTKGYFDTNMDLNQSVRITTDMYDDLLRNDLFEVFNADRYGKHQIAMAHGREDDVIDPAAAERFALKFGIPVTWFPGEGHSLSKDPGTPFMVADLAIALYREGDTKASAMGGLD